MALQVKASPKKDGQAQDPPVIRYKSVNSKFRAQLAAEGSQLANAMKRVPPRVKALGGPILDDFISIATLCDTLESKVEVLQKELGEQKQSTEMLNQRLEEGRTTFDMLVTRFTNSVEQATQLRQQVDEERHDTSQRHRETGRRGENDGIANTKELATLRAQIAEMDKELAVYRTNSTLSIPDSKSRKEHNRKQEIQKLTAENESLREDLNTQLAARRTIEEKMEKQADAAEKRDAEYQDLLRKFEATNRILERSQDKLAVTNEFLQVNDDLAAHDALARILNLNEEISQLAGIFVARCSFLEDGDEEFPNPYARESRNGSNAGGEEGESRQQDLVHRFLSPRFPPLLINQDHEKRRLFLDLAIRACLVHFMELIINSGCFGLREDLDAFFLQLWGIVKTQHPQATAGRWRALTHQSIRSSPQFPVNRTLVPSMVRTLGSILRMARVVRPEVTAEGFEDDLTALHANAVALEIDFKEKVFSTAYTARTAAMDTPFLAVEMIDVSILMDGLREESMRMGVKSVLACVALGLTATQGTGTKSRKSLSGKKGEVRQEPTVLLDTVLS
ncbi:SubName: Full=Uncharacterized protein {ECO:0000313/EMBL:CCA77829.1} [Serendipita indica DSM 11827]|nr:SubName: Full=Uncharacterized protein {ECO:0000313/EMBL:CCA77829.1} [Serendipita indica DSM 11827]